MGNASNPPEGNSLFGVRYGPLIKERNRMSKGFKTMAVVVVEGLSVEEKYSKGISLILAKYLLSHV